MDCADDLPEEMESETGSEELLSDDHCPYDQQRARTGRVFPSS
ncbi:MAG TPA: hypothetical protein VH593_03775 [Ktedonobacteraceae bacterium]